MIPFDASGAFRPLGAGGELRRVAVRSAAAALSAAALSLGMRVVGTVVLARLLTPADFGVVTMVTTFSLLLSSFGLNGFTEAVIQFEEMDHYTASNLFWLNMRRRAGSCNRVSGSGVALGAFLPKSACGECRRRFVSGSFHSFNLRYPPGSAKACACVSHLHQPTTLSPLLYTPLLTILLAARGWGYWALVGGMVANQLSLTIGAWWLVPMDSEPAATDGQDRGRTTVRDESLRAIQPPLLYAEH